MAEQYGLLLISKPALILIIISAVLLAGIIVLYFWGRHLQKRQDKNREIMQANRQQVSMLVIDKKKMKLSEAGLPAGVLESLPKLYRRSKMYIVKGKVGNQVMPFICEYQLYEQIPVKKEIKAGISGLYILDVKGVRGSLEKRAPKLSFKEKLKQRKIEKRQLAEQERLKAEKAEKKAAVKQRQEQNRKAVSEKQSETPEQNPEDEKKKPARVIRRGNSKKRK